ncbi:MAG: MqnA/MqnD/SBP family protein, partial [Chitinophagales bacterium]
VDNLHIAIPGVHTTANLLCSIAFPDAKNKTSMIFSAIEDAVVSGMADAGVIIHENRFTYQQKGLKKIIDLGAFWEHTYQLPIPLGAIAVKRNIPHHLQQRINTLMRHSVQYAMQNPEQTRTYVKLHAQEMDESVMQQHIHLYVNAFTENLGDKGKHAAEQLFRIAHTKGIIPQVKEKVWVE